MKSVDSNWMLHAARGFGLAVLDPREGKVRIILSGEDPVMLENLDATARLAVTGVDILTLRSIQAKGHVLSLEDATTADRHS